MGRSLLRVLFLLIATLATCHAVELPTLQQPRWKELSAEQQQILAPLEGEWDQLESLRRKKWVGIAARYPKMTPEEQERIQTQMRDWAKLSPQQRKVAREKYKTLTKASPEQKANLKQQWALYKELPEDEKKRLQDAAKVRPPAKRGIGMVASQPMRPVATLRVQREKQLAANSSPPHAVAKPVKKSANRSTRVARSVTPVRINTASAE